MKITIESTSKIVSLKLNNSANEIPARIWEGTTESGIKVHCYVTRIAIDKDEPNAQQFEKELIEQKVPSVEIEALPGRLIL